MGPAEESDELGAPLIRQPNGLWEGQYLKCVKYGSLFVLLVSTVACEVLKKQVQIAAPDFPNTITQLMPLAGIVVFPIVVLCALALGSIPYEAVTVHWMKPCIIGISFCLHHTLMNLGARGKVVPGAVVIALSKLVIPASMLLGMSRRSLGYRYALVHWVAALVLLVGIFMMAAQSWHPEKQDLMDEDDDDDDDDDDDGDEGMVHEVAEKTVLLVRVILISLSTLPLAFAFVYIEKNLKKVERGLSSMALWMWVCCFQLLTGIVLTPITGTLRGMGYEATFAELSDGCECLLLGRNPSTTAYVQIAGESQTQCSRARISFFAFLVPSFAMNFCMPVVARYGSAALLWFVRALAVAAGSTLFASRTVMGRDRTSLGPVQGVGVLLVTLGVLLFSAKEPEMPLELHLHDPELSTELSGCGPEPVEQSKVAEETSDGDGEGEEPVAGEETQERQWQGMSPMDWLRIAVPGCWGCMLALLPPEMNPNENDNPWGV